MGEQQLSALVGSLRLGPSETSEVLRLAKEHHYQLACSRHFEAAHPGFAAMDIKLVGGYDLHIQFVLRLVLGRRGGESSEPVVPGLPGVRPPQERGSRGADPLSQPRHR